MNVRLTIDTNEIETYLGRVLENLDLMDDVARRYLEQGMELALGLAQVNVAVDTGNLRDSIRLEDYGPGGIALIADAVDPYNGFGYAPKIEAEQPFIGPAIDEVLPEMIAGLVAQLSSIFTKDVFMRRGEEVSMLRDVATGRFVKRVSV